jgi:hypothetical protein
LRRLHSIYFRDPNGYVVELTARMPHHDEATDHSKNGAHDKLKAWQRKKARAAQTRETKPQADTGEP